jgi:hypothetical protein
LYCVYLRKKRVSTRPQHLHHEKVKRVVDCMG